MEVFHLPISLPQMLVGYESQVSCYYLPFINEETEIHHDKIIFLALCLKMCSRVSPSYYNSQPRIKESSCSIQIKVRK